MRDASTCWFIPTGGSSSLRALSPTTTIVLCRFDPTGTLDGHLPGCLMLVPGAWQPAGRPTGAACAQC
jgi:hypothetical protein